MRSLLLIAALSKSLALFSFPILEKGVGPWTYDPALAGSDSTWVITWNQEGNIAGQIAYSFFDPQKGKMTAQRPIKDLIGIKPKIYLNSLNQGLILVDTTQNLISCYSFQGLPPSTENISKVAHFGMYANSINAYYLDNGFAFCAFTDSSRSLNYSFFNSVQNQFNQAITMPQIQVGKIVLCAGSSDEPCVVYSDLKDNSLFYSFYNKLKQRFDPCVKIVGSEDCASASISMNAQGKGILAWNTGAATTLAGRICYSIIDRASKTFSEATMIAQEANGFNPVVKMNKEGASILSWTRLTSTGKDSLAAAYYDPAMQTFLPTQYIKNASFYANSCSLSFNDASEAILCWFATLSGRIEYALFDNVTQRFLPAEFVKETGVNSQYPKVELNSLGNALMTWSVLGGIEYALLDKSSKRFSKAKMILNSSNSSETGDL